MDNRLASLRRLLRIHMNWLTVKLLGKELVSKEELAELKNYGKLPSGDEVGLVERSFILGRVSALSNKSEYKDLTLKKLSKFQKRKFSSVEKLALREAKLHTAHRLNALADSAAAGASARVNQVTQDLLSDATVKEIVEDELALALAEKKTRQQLASSIGNRLGTDMTSGFKKLMVTEMHRAKTRGIAMAIANKVDIYSSSGGAESSVSVVPNRDACKDCHNLYLTDTGNPRVFKLKDLVAQGANSDEGVSHARTRGYHMGWKPVMPPAHPNCFCELVYVPPGMGWEDGRLVITDEFRYKDHISKAVDQSQLSAKVKPKGPEKTQGNDIPKPGSIPGIAAPGNVAGPGRPAGSGAGAQAAPPPEAGAASGMKECPFGGGQACKDNRGNGFKEHKVGGSIMKEHEKILSEQGKQEEAEALQVSLTPEQIASQLMDIGQYKQGAHSKSQQDEDLSSGTVIHRQLIEDVVEDASEAGITSKQSKVEKLDIADNGSGLKKPPLFFYPHTAGHEVGANVVQEIYGAPNDLGGNGRCAHTTYRIEDSQKCSIQGWVYGTRSGLAKYKKAAEKGETTPYLTPQGMVKYLLKSTNDKAKTRADMEETVCSDIILNNTDRHGGNMMFGEENAYAIDHGFAFGIGMNGYRNHYHEGMVNNNYKIRVPDGMREKINNTSFDQLHGSLSEHTTTWRAAQTYLRSHYLLHVQEEFGHLPYKEIGGGESHGGDNFATIAGVRYDDPTSFDTKGNAAFEAFAFDWIDDRVADPSHPEHQTAKRFQEEGIFQSPIADVVGRKQGQDERAKGTHLKYEKFARSHRYLMTPEAGKEAKMLAAGLELRKTGFINEMNSELKELTDKVKPLVEEQHRLRGQSYTPEAAKGITDALEVVRKKLIDLRAEERGAVMATGQKIMDDKMEVVSNFVPPGKEELYKTLDSKIADIEGGKKPKLDISLNTGFSPKKRDQAAMDAGARRMVEAGKQLREAKEAKDQAVTKQVSQSPAAAIESSKQVRAQEVALSHHGKMLKDARRDLKRMKRGVPEERKAKLQGKVRALEAQYNEMQDKFDKLGAN